MLTPGNFVKFNYICTEYNILPTGDFLANMKLLLNLYKKEKNSLYINFIFFLVDYYLNKLKRENVLRNDKIYEIRNYIFTNLNNFILYNINQNIFINTVKSKLQNE